MEWKSYPKTKDTPNRKARKSERNKVFQHNYKLRSKLNRQKRDERIPVNND